MVTEDDTPQPAIATVFYGRSSFIAASISDALLRSGIWSLRIADTDPDSGDSPAYIHTDLSNRVEVLSAVAGATAVFLVDPTLSSPPVSTAGVGFYGLHRIVVGGARTVLAACREAGVRRLVYTGSADVVSNGVYTVDGADESMPYPEKFFNVLNELRAQTEKMILSANSEEGFSTCVLRTSNVFGPRDQYLVPLLVREARLGHARFIIGNSENISDFIYVENVTHANICAEHALCSGKASVDGQPFFITNHKPVKTWEFISSILEGLGYARPSFFLPRIMVLSATMMRQQLSRKLGLCSSFNWLLFPTSVYGLSCRTFNASKAQNLIGYSPIVPLEDGIKLTVQSFSHLASERFYKRQTGHTGLSKADEWLGNGVADLLLWRDEKKTFICALVSFFLYYWFLLSGRTFISSIAKFFLLVSAVLFVHCNLPSSMIGFNVKKVPLSRFEVSELTVRNCFMMAASIWNSGISKLKLAPEIYDWKDFFKVVASLYVLKWMLSFPLPLLVGFSISLAFTVFLIFDQFEVEIVKLIRAALTNVEKLWGLVHIKLSSFLPI